MSVRTGKEGTNKRASSDSLFAPRRSAWHTARPRAAHLAAQGGNQGIRADWYGPFSAAIAATRSGESAASEATLAEASAANRERYEPPVANRSRCLLG